MGQPTHNSHQLLVKSHCSRRQLDQLNKYLLFTLVYTLNPHRVLKNPQAFISLNAQVVSFVKIMHAIKGGWVGQTFALAKHNESEGRKSRVRLSKEERKTMVESFIKKYQSSNNGNFPSLNLTHKEVGGSFYTVREIVREVIQENRVLGPAKLSPNELSTNQFDEQYQLGSISKEPQTPLNITSNGSNFMPNHHQGTSREPIAISDELFSEHENQRLDNEGIINGSQVDVRNEESAKTTCEELQTSKPSEAEERVKKSEASRAMVTLIAAEVVVETFPLRPVPKAAESSNARSGVDNVTETSEENEMEKADLDSGNGSASLDQINSSAMSGLLDEKNGKSREGLVVDIKSDLVDMEVVENFTDPQVSHANFSTTEGGTVHDTLAGENVGVEVPNNDVVTSERYEKSQSIDGTKEINTTNGKIPNNTYGSNTRVESETPKAVLIADEADVQRKESFRRRNNPKSDSINLDSWDGASRNSAEKEINPLLAIVKSFVTAFIKFWSE